MSRQAVITENLKCFLSDQQRAEMSDKLVRVLQEQIEVGEQLAEVKADFKSRLESLAKLQSSLTNILAKGYEYKDVECTVVFNHPHPRLKTILRRDVPGEIVREMPMTEDECQEVLPLDAETKEAISETQPPNGETEGFHLEHEAPPPEPEQPVNGKDAAAGVN